MEHTDRDFDVAISFLHEDLEAATQLRNALAGSLEVFIYTKKQEDLAGTDGLESFRAVFRRRARLVVILLRGGWGKTPWTRVEMEAITDRFLGEGGDFLFVIMMEDCVHPPWIPDKLVRFSLRDFGIEQAVGAIKARAMEQGSELHRPSPAFLAAQAQRRAQFAQKRQTLFRADVGVRQADAEARRLMKLIEDQSEEARQAAPGLEIAFGSDAHSAVIRFPSVAVSCAYRNQIINVLDEARLFLTEFRGQIFLPGEGGYYRVKPNELASTEFCPELTEELGWCWRDKKARVHSSEEISIHFVELFFDLVERQSAGKLPRIEW